jgi:hypothetical protein
VPRIAYTGPDPDGMELVLDGRPVHVGQGKQVEVPAAVRDELVQREGWSEVKDPGGAKAKAAKDDDAKDEVS